jgi:glyoxylase-like metal-dependent hydrolase (beta-lactamase superfamily II)
MRRTFVLPTLVLLFATSAFPQRKPVYEVYAIRYAITPDYPINDLVYGADPSRKADIAMMIWLVRGGGHNILVDSGFYREHFFKGWKTKDYVKPSDAVAKLGLKPVDITDIIISHMHWDHVDGVDLFPKARIWVQKDELEYYAGEAWETKQTSDGFDAQDVIEMVKLNTEGHVGGSSATPAASTRISRSMLA